MYEKFGQFIDGKWQQSEKKETYEVINPATEEILGHASKVSDKESDDYFSSRDYGSKIGAWASDQSSVLNKRQDLIDSIKKYKDKFPKSKNVPRPKHWSGWRLKPDEIEFWLDGENRIHERLKYIKKETNWNKVLLSP